MIVYVDGIALIAYGGEVTGRHCYLLVLELVLELPSACVVRAVFAFPTRLFVRPD